MAKDPSNDPETIRNEPESPSPIEQPEAPESAEARPESALNVPGGAAQGSRIILMSLAILATAFLLYREYIQGDAGRGGGGSTAYSWEVVSADGSPVDLKQFEGRPVLLNVWATWCPPCLVEMPSLIALSKRPELEEAGVAVVLVSIDDGLEPVQRFLDRTDVGNAEVLVAASITPEEFSTGGIPATFLIDPDGRIVRREVGAMDWNTPEIAAELASLAKGR